MAKNALVTALPADSEVAARLNRLSEELVFAWDRSDPGLLKQWSLGAALAFGASLKRRATNLIDLVSTIGKGTWSEATDALQAIRSDRFRTHVNSRAGAAYESGVDLAARIKVTTTQTAALLRSRPREALPQLVTMVGIAALVSGGPDGDGGAPDLDLMFGIGAHRSILSHSVLMGAALETAFLSLVSLVQLLHAKLPERHDTVWDTLSKHADSIAQAASTGASIGMSYHLFVDGLLQPAAYHDLPISLPMEGHQAIMTANGLAEAIDTRHKPVSRSTKHNNVSPYSEHSADEPVAANASARNAASRVREQVPDADIVAHRRCLAERFLVNPFVADMLSDGELLVLEKYGCWLKALSTGELLPLSAAQRRFVKVANGRERPESEYECAWRMYTQLVQLAPQA